MRKLKEKFEQIIGRELPPNYEILEYHPRYFVIWDDENECIVIILKPLPKGIEDFFEVDEEED